MYFGKYILKFIDILAIRSVFFQQEDLGYRLKKIASDESLEYVHNNMRNIVCIADTSVSMIDLGLENVTINGLYLEFGVWVGKTTKHIANKIKPNKLYGFDSFSGLPENWASAATKGYFSLNGEIPKLPENVVVHKGWFADSLKEFEVSEPISFIHIDCDVYSSTKTVFDHIGKHIVKGTIIVFDEYFNYPYWQEHEFKAFQEFVDKNSIEYEYIAFSGADKVCVKILSQQNITNEGETIKH